MSRPLDQCRALLFDGSQPEACSRLFTKPLRAWHVAAPIDDGAAARLQLHSALAEMDAAACAGAHIVLSLSYEAAQGFEVASTLPVQSKVQAHADLSVTPWLQAMAFSPPQLLSREQALTWLKSQADNNSPHLISPQACVDEDQFNAIITQIRERIAAGETYQVNYTFPFVADLLAYSPHHPDGALAAVYHEWVHDLRIAYGAWLMWPHNSVLSFSPELLVALKGNQLTCRPMKGTAAVGLDDTDSAQRAAQLAADPKNRAENLMIVDLMRNDLSHLPQTQAVRVPKLFDVKRYGAVLQMTSTIRADLDGQPRLHALLDALFPCGSITGAPKRRTMGIINELESFARGAYCGTIGHLIPSQNGRFDASFSVPIRTLESCAIPLTTSLGAQRWPIQCSVGAGVTYDSVAHDEWVECQLKARFFTRHGRPWELIETMRAERVGGDWQIPWLEAHLVRMARSARVLGWSFVAQDFYKHVNAALQQVSGSSPLRVRVVLQPMAKFSVTCAVLEPWVGAALFAIHSQRVDAGNPFLQHKTSVRELYNQALQQARVKNLFDYVFVNTRGEVSEGARSSIFIRVNDEWLTPPLRCGVLPGIARAALLADKTFGARESVFGLEALYTAQAVMLCNALHQLPAQRIEPL